MAKYEVTMSCGHTQTIELFGKMDARYKKIEWLEKHGLCNECYKAQQEAERAEATAKAAEKAIADKLPELTGTEKQVNWALTIREKFLAEVDKKVEDNKNRMDADTLAKSELQATAIKKVMAKFTEARFWIDNRDKSLRQIIMSNDLAEIIKSEIANLMIIAVTDDIATADAVDASVKAMTASTAEVVMSDVEDDGSNDDDEEESVLDTVGFNFDDDDDDDDELVDEPEIGNAAADETQSIVQFEANKTYRGFAPDGRSETASISRRTRCTVNVNGLKRRIYVDNGVEYIKYVNQIKVYADAVADVQDVEESKVEEVQAVADVQGVEENEVEEVQAVAEPQTLVEYRTVYGEALGTIMYMAYGCQNIQTLAEYQVAYGNDLGTKLYNAANGIKMSKNAKFEVGKVYVALDDCQTVVFYTATERTAKNVTFKHLVDDSVTITQYEINFDDDGNEIVCGLLNSAIDYIAETPQVEVNTLSIAKLDAIHTQLFGATGADDTCSTLKSDDTASLQAELDNAENAAEICQQDVDESERLLAYYRRMYIETIAKLAVIEDKITEYGLILHEDKKALMDVETCAAAIRAQIDSQKYSAQKLLDAVNAVDDTVAVDTITFELQKFTGGEGEKKTEEIETKFRADEKDTNTELTPANTFTEVVSSDDEEEVAESPEDREFDRLKSTLITDIHDLEIEIEVLEKRIKELSKIKLNTLIKLSKKVLELQKFLSKNIIVKPNTTIEIISSVENKSYILDGESQLDGVKLKAEISTYNGLIEVYIDINGDEMVLLATYQSVTKFKAAIRGLAAAIKRGDKQFKFPDDNPKNKKTAS